MKWKFSDTLIAIVGMVRWLDSWTVRIVGKSKSWNGWMVGMVRQVRMVRKSESRTVGKTDSQKFRMGGKSEWFDSWKGWIIGKSEWLHRSDSWIVK